MPISTQNFSHQTLFHLAVCCQVSASSERISQAPGQSRTPATVLRRNLNPCSHQSPPIRKYTPGEAQHVRNAQILEVGTLGRSKHSPYKTASLQLFVCDNRACAVRPHFSVCIFNVCSRLEDPPPGLVLYTTETIEPDPIPTQHRTASNPP